MHCLNKLVVFVHGGITQMSSIVLGAMLLQSLKIAGYY